MLRRVYQIVLNRVGVIPLFHNAAEACTERKVDLLTLDGIQLAKLGRHDRYIVCRMCGVVQSEVPVFFWLVISPLEEGFPL